MTTIAEAIKAVTESREHSEIAFEGAVDTAGPEYAGGSKAREREMREAADACDDAYEDALAALESQDVSLALQELETARSLESDAGDDDDARAAIAAVRAIADHAAEELEAPVAEEPSDIPAHLAVTSDGVEIVDGNWVVWQGPRGDSDAVEIGYAELSDDGEGQLLDIVWTGSGRELVSGTTIKGTSEVFEGPRAKELAEARYREIEAQRSERELA